MRKKTASALLSTLLLFGMSQLAVNIPRATTSLLVRNVDTGEDFAVIQEAIDDPDTLDGHTILVAEGIYYENLVINKSLSLIGERASNTIIDGMHKGDVVHISADNVGLCKFTIINSKNQGGYAGINSRNVKTCSIRENNILANWRGIWLHNCTDNIIHSNSILNTTESLAIWIQYCDGTVISSNIITNNPSGIYLYYSDNNVVRRNSITDNKYYGLTLTESNGSLIDENVITNSYEWDGVALWSSCHNTVTANNILNNQHGIRLGLSSNNTMYHNNLIGNAIQAYDTYKEYHSEPSMHSWDNGYPSGGNYWSDYEDRYPDAAEIDGSGVWDTPYVINEKNQDNYPLMDPWSPPPSIPTTIKELETEIEELGSEGEIDKQGIVRSLLAKLNVAQKLVDKGKTDEAESILEEAFIPQVQNLSGIHISIEAADLLIESAEYIVAHACINHLTHSARAVFLDS